MVKKPSYGLTYHEITHLKEFLRVTYLTLKPRKPVMIAFIITSH